MNRNDPRQAASVLLVGLACVLTAALAFAPWFAEGNALRAWWWAGLQLWSFHEGYRLLAAFAPLLVFALSEEQFDALWRRLVRLRDDVVAAPWLPVALPFAALVVLWVLRSVSMPFGDSYFYASDLIPREAFSLRGMFVRYDSVGTTSLYSLGFRYAQQWLAMDIVTWYNLAGIASSMVFGAWLWRVRNRGMALCSLGALAVLLLGNWSQSCFGAVEHYGQVYLAAVAFAMLGVEAITGREPLWKPALAFAMGAFFHLVIGWLLPALALLFVLCWRSQSKAGREAAVLALVIPAALTGALLYFFGFDLSFWEDSNAAEGKLIPFLDPRHAYTGVNYQYSTFDRQHLFHIAQEVWLMGWPGVLAMAGTLPLLSVAVLRDRRVVFAAAFFGCTLLFNLLWNPDLGFWRDQDLFALSGVGACVMGATLLFVAPGRGLPVGVRRRLLLAAVLGGLLWRAPVALYHSVLDPNYAEPALLSSHWPFNEFEPPLRGKVPAQD